MTKLLELAFEEASKFPDADQDAFAAILLEEMESERRWDELFAKSQDKLDVLGDRVLAEHRAGKSKPLQFDPP